MSVLSPVCRQPVVGVQLDLAVLVHLGLVLGHRLSTRNENQINNHSNIGHYRGDNGLHELVISLATSDNQSGLKQLENKIL